MAVNNQTNKQTSNKNKSSSVCCRHKIRNQASHRYHQCVHSALKVTNVWDLDTPRRCCSKPIAMAESKFRATHLRNCLTDFDETWHLKSCPKSTPRRIRIIQCMSMISIVNILYHRRLPWTMLAIRPILIVRYALTQQTHTTGWKLERLLSSTSSSISDPPISSPSLLPLLIHHSNSFSLSLLA